MGTYRLHQVGNCTWEKLLEEPICGSDLVRITLSPEGTLTLKVTHGQQGTAEARWIKENIQTCVGSHVLTLVESEDEPSANCCWPSTVTVNGLETVFADTKKPCGCIDSPRDEDPPYWQEPCPCADGTCGASGNSTDNIFGNLTGALDWLFKGSEALQYSDAGIRYFNGQLRYRHLDMATAGFGIPWTMRREYGNRMTFTGNMGFGYNWFFNGLPYIKRESPTLLTMQLGSGRGVRYLQTSPTTYQPQYGAMPAMDFVPSEEEDSEFKVFDPASGVIVRFTALGSIAVFKKATLGDAAIEADFDDQAGRYTKLSKSAGGETEEIVFIYHDSGPLKGNLQYQTLRRSSGSGWIDIRRTVYDYYDGTNSHGSLSDLRSVTRQEWNGSSLAGC